MRSIIAASALCSFAVAAPRPQPQKINIKVLDDLPTPSVLGPVAGANTTPAVTYVPEIAASSAAAAISTDPPRIDRSPRSKRDDDCAMQPGGAGPVPGDGSVEAYLASDSILAQNAMSASTPSGYTQSFVNAHGSVQQVGYLTYRTIESGLYSVDSCQAFCESMEYCQGFNIYYERDPSVYPAAACPNPPPITRVKCSLYGYPVSEQSVTDSGQSQGPPDANGQMFRIVIAGSNGYSKISNRISDPDPNSALSNFTGPVYLPGAIDAPLYKGFSTYNGERMYNSGPFDPSLCAAACTAQTDYDQDNMVSANGRYRPCNFFTAYILTKNDVPQGTYCAFYTRPWDSSYATNTGYTSGNDVYEVKDAVAYTLTEQDPGREAPAPTPTPTPTAT